MDQIQKVDNLKIYPNPVSDKLNISCNDAMIDKIRIFNILGQLKLHIANIDKSSLEIDFSELEKSIYIIDIESYNRMLTKSIVKF